MKRWLQGIVWMSVVALAAPAAWAGPVADDREAGSVLEEAECSLSQAVEMAEADVPGTTKRARLKRGRPPGGDALWFYKVVVFDDDRARHVRRYEARSCDEVFPTAPEIAMTDAIATAHEVVDGGISLGARLRFPGLVPVYDVILTKRYRRWVVRIDGVSGEVLAARRWHPRHDAQLDEDEDGEIR